MHIGQSCGTKYYMKEGFTRKELESVQEERDLGVIINADLKSSSQCIKSAATARKVIEIVRRNFRHLDIDHIRFIQDLNSATILEFCIQAWSPTFRQRQKY